MKQSIAFNRRQFLAALATATAGAIIPSFAMAGDDLPAMHVYKSPSCGCCGAWVDIVRDAGFDVTVTDLDDLDPVKRQAGIPDALQSCHTAVIDGYIVEGHVPVPAIKKLLAERPEMRGIAVPGMPFGSPGMGVDPNARYDVIAFGAQSRAQRRGFLSRRAIANPKARRKRTAFEEANYVVGHGFSSSCRCL